MHSKYRYVEDGKAEEIFGVLNAGILHKTVFPRPEKRLVDYIVRRGTDTALVKFSEGVNTSSAMFKELKKILNLLKINALLIAEKINNENTVEGVLHIRDRIGIASKRTLQAVADGNSVYVYEFKGMYYVKINGKKLRELRITKGYGLSELAKAVGTSVKAIQKYEDGLIDMSIEKACRFMEIFGDEFGQVLKEVDIFNDRILETHIKEKPSIEIDSRGIKCQLIRLLRKIISHGAEVETFNYFPSDIVVSKENIRIFISIIDNRSSPDVAVLKARENIMISKALNGVPINIVDEGIPRDVVKELEGLGPVLSCKDIDERDLMLE